MLLSRFSNLRFFLGLTASHLLQPLEVTIPNIGVSTVGVAVGILPDGLELPAARNGSWGGTVSGKDKRAVSRESLAVASAGVPPIGSGIDHGVAAGGRVIGRNEVLNPVDHRRSAQTVAGAS